MVSMDHYLFSKKVDYNLKVLFKIYFTLKFAVIKKFFVVECQ